ncbi:MAG: copper transporter [Actinomycetota bacterium]
MISFRYHLVTIVAVFLALGLGVLVGTTVIDQRLVAGLEEQAAAAEVQREELRAELDQLSVLVTRQDAFIRQLAPELIAGQLAGRDVVLVTYEGTDDSVLSQSRDALDASGADVVAIFSVTPKMGMPDTPTREELAQLVGANTGVTPSQLSREAAKALGRRLASGSDGAEDPLKGFLSRGFVESVGPEIKEADLPDVGGRGQAIVVLAGSETEPPVGPDEFMVPLVEELANQRVAVAAGESATSSYEFIGLLRDRDAVQGEIVTVDDASESVGGVALVLGLRDLISFGRGGDFGFKSGAAELVPQA